LLPITLKRHDSFGSLSLSLSLSLSSLRPKTRVGVAAASSSFSAKRSARPRSVVRTCCRSGAPVSFPLGGAENRSLHRTLAAAKSRYLCSALMIDHLTCDICRSLVYAHPRRPTAAAVSSSIRNTRNVYDHRPRAVALSFISRNERDRVIVHNRARRCIAGEICCCHVIKCAGECRA